MFNKIRIGTKLVGGFILVAIIAGLIGITGIQNIKKIDDKDTFLYEKCTIPLGDLVTINSKFQETRVFLLDMIRENDADAILIKSTKLNDQNKAQDSAMQHYTTTLINENDKRIFESLKLIDNKWAVFCEKVENLAKENKDAEAYALVSGEGAQIVSEEQAKIEAMVTANIDAAKSTSDNNAKTANNASVFMIITMIIGSFITIIIGVLLKISLTRPLARVVQMIQEIGKGHLSMRLKMNSEDEIGILAKTMDKLADDLQNIVIGTMQKISEGDISMNIELKDSQDEVSPALKRMIDSLRSLIEEAKYLENESVNGNLSKRGNTEKFKGAYRDIVSGVNKILDEVISPINEATGVLEKLAERDLTARVKGNYKGDHAKIKTAVNTTAENLDQALTQVLLATEQVSSASQQISAGSQSLAEGANEQASSLEEISSSLEEMSSMTKQNAENANQAKALSAEADDNASNGTESMEKMSAAINKIKESSDQTAKIVKTIDEIAMQTNLLALNAAVEAARAGEAGRGFAVVAEEVRNLAQRSAQAAKNTADMITESVKNANDGVLIAEDVSKSFALITDSAKKVNNLISEIAVASQEQAQGIDQINNAVAQMDKVTQQNAANSEESASASEELSSQAKELANMIGQFNVSRDQSKTISAPLIAQTSINTEISKAKHPAKPKNGIEKKMRKNSMEIPSVRINAEEIIPMDDEMLKEF